MPDARPSRKSRTRPAARSRRATTMRVRMVALVGGLLAALLVLAAFVAPAGAARDTRPVQAVGGGGPQLPKEVWLPSGGQFDGLFPLYLSNPNRSVLSLRIVERVPSGIAISPEQRTVNVSPGQTVRVPYTLRIDSAMAAGSYPVEVAAVPGPLEATDNEVRFVNAIVQRYTVVVSGSAGDLRARAIDSVDQQPVAGVFIASRITGVTPVPVARVEGPLFTARLVPGEYEIVFELEGRRIASKQVKVAEGRTTDAELSVSLLQFTGVEALQIEADGRIAAVALNAQFDNVLRPITNMVFTLEVTRDGKTVDEMEVQRFQTLAKGAGSVSTRYVPTGGWLNGKYEFRFRMVADGLSVAAAERPAIQVGPKAASGTWWFWAAAFTLLALLALAATTWLLRRRRRPRGPSPQQLAVDPETGGRLRRFESDGEPVAARSEGG